MSTTDTTQRRGHAAKRILDDTEIMQAFGEIEAELVTQWAATNPLCPEHREAIFRQVKALELFQQQLETWKNNLAHYDARVVQSSLDSRGQGAEA